MNRIIKISLHLLNIVGLAVFSLGVQAACLGDQETARAYKVYIVPQMTATQIYTRWGARTRSDW